jgi:hypothetical protein
LLIRKLSANSKEINKNVCYKNTIRHHLKLLRVSTIKGDHQTLRMEVAVEHFYERGIIFKKTNLNNIIVLKPPNTNLYHKHF